MKPGRKSWKERASELPIDWDYGTIYGKYSKYKKGEVIKDINVLLNEKVIIWQDIAKHVEMIKSLPLRVVLMALERGNFYKAILKEKGESNGN